MLNALEKQALTEAKASPPSRKFVTAVNTVRLKLRRLDKVNRVYKVCLSNIQTLKPFKHRTIISIIKEYCLSIFS